MTSGERRLAERLEQKLDDDNLLWYDVPVGPQQLHPDFIVLHPSRGLLILEVKDFRLSTIVQAAKDEWTILDNASGEPKPIQSPFAQARNYAHAVLGALRADKRLVHPDGRRQGEVVFAWSYGVVLPNITRKQPTDSQLDQAIAAHRVFCSGETTGSVVAADLLTAGDKDADGIPLVKRVSCGREEQAPSSSNCPPARRSFCHCGSLGQRPGPTQAAAPRAQEEWRIPARRGCGSGDDHEDQQGLEFPVRALPCVRYMSAAGDDEKEAARVFYVAAMRATQRLGMS